MATASIANIDLTILDNNVFAIINHLRKQHKRANLEKIYNELIKTINFENTSREHFHDRINELIQGKIVNKPNIEPILNNWNILASRELTCLLPHLILNSHLPLNP